MVGDKSQTKIESGISNESDSSGTGLGLKKNLHDATKSFTTLSGWTLPKSTPSSANTYVPKPDVILEDYSSLSLDMSELSSQSSTTEDDDSFVCEGLDFDWSMTCECPAPFAHEDPSASDISSILEDTSPEKTGNQDEAHGPVVINTTEHQTPPSISSRNISPS